MMDSFRGFVSSCLAIALFLSSSGTLLEFLCSENFFLGLCVLHSWVWLMPDFKEGIGWDLVEGDVVWWSMELKIAFSFLNCR